MSGVESTLADRVARTVEDKRHAFAIARFRALLPPRQPNVLRLAARETPILSTWTPVSQVSHFGGFEPHSVATVVAKLRHLFLARIDG